MQNIEIFQKAKKIAEFGAGYSGLAGLALAKRLLHLPSKNFEIEISDGNS